MTQRKRDTAAAVVRAAMRWYRSFNLPANGKEIYESDEALEKACASHAARKGGKRGGNDKNGGRQ